jgi:hypothetical protein
MSKRRMTLQIVGSFRDKGTVRALEKPRVGIVLVVVVCLHVAQMARSVGAVDAAVEPDTDRRLHPYPFTVTWKCFRLQSISIGT